MSIIMVLGSILKMGTMQKMRLLFPSTFKLEQILHAGTNKHTFDDKEDSSTPQVQHDGVEVTPCSQLVSSSWKKELHCEQVLASMPLIAHGPSPRMSCTSIEGEGKSMST